MILSRYTVKNIGNPSIAVPDEAMFELPEKVLQFGTGVLLRGLPDYFIDKANRQGIFNGRVVVVKSTSQGDSSAFEKQDGLYTLCVRGVDFYCPRGWAWAENCTFFAHTGPASIWHDGSNNPDFKTVLKNCSFDGFEGFKLGRYHREAQFYLVNCQFSKNMADTDIYFVPGNTTQWGRRVYYANCRREGGN